MSLSEHDLIREIRALLAEESRAVAGGGGVVVGPGSFDSTDPLGRPRSGCSGVVVGPGDDCAVVAPEAGRELVMTTDASVEGVHFRLDWMDAETAGRRAMVANLSDVAAMAGRPRWALLALELPRETPAGTTLAIVRGAARAAGEAGALVVGGNLSRTSGPIAITISLTGDVEAGRALRRSGARPGDELWASGRPGETRAGLLALERGLDEDPEAAPFVARFRRPDARLALARDLRDRAGARAMIDISDGLTQDLARLLEESGAGASLDLRSLERGLGEALPRFAARLGVPPVELALEGGEDYELAWASPPGAVAAVRAELEARHGLPLTALGRVEAAAGLRRSDGSPVASKGFDHFGSE